MIATPLPTVFADASAVVALLAQSNVAGAWAAYEFACVAIAAPDLTHYEVANTLRRKAREGRYDAAYVALSELLGAPLVTLDARIARAPGVRRQVLAYPG